MSIGVGLFTATTWGWDVVRIWPWAQYRNPYSGGWEIKSARVLEILWAVGLYHRLPGDSSARAILEHPHLAWPFLFLFPFTDLWLAFCPGTEGLGVFRDFPDSTTPASVRQDSARQYQSPSDGLKTVCAGLWHLRHKLNNNWALCWQHVMTGVVNKLAQGPLSYVAIVSHDHSSTPSHSWGCCVYPAWGCPGWGCPGWEPAPAHLLLHWWHRSSVGPGRLPLQLNCPSGVRPCAQAPTQVGSSPSSTPPSPSPHRHACLPPVTRALPETAAEHGHPKTEQRPWRKEITSDVWKPKCIKMVILGNFRTLLDVLIFMLWSIVVFVFSSPEGVHHSWKYCNTRSMRGVDRASSLF